MADATYPSLRATPLRDEIHRILLDRITSGELPPGTRLRDVALAANLGVSRTPVREALLRLEREGFLVADHRRGFAVRGVDDREIRETYPLVWTLEVLALRTGAPHTAETLAQLGKLSRAMRSTRATPSELTALDHDWHELLAKASGNSRLLATLAPLKAAIHRYERSYMRSRADVRRSADEHDVVVEALSAGRIDRAAQHLERHWKRGLEAVLGKVARQR